jgi:hypothetical protein
MNPPLSPFNLALRAGCIAAYVLAAVSLAGWMPPGWFGRVQTVAALLLGVHAVEALLMQRQLRLYRGPLAVSVLLTVLFGFLHWKPLVDQQTRQSPPP